MEYIKAPFNFVPVSKEVFYPGWADQISHDVPFSDGLSGQLTVELKAKTPIFIRDSKDKTKFCHIKYIKNKDEETRYFIPGTSLKGTIRNVLEILSFSKMDKINDHKFAVRDLHNSGLYNLMTDAGNIQCGWLSLKKDKNNIETASIRNCGIPWRVSHKELDDNLSTQFVSTFKKFGSAFIVDKKGTTYKDKKRFVTAEYKYSLLTGGITVKNFKKGPIVNGKQLCSFSSNLKDPKGRIVLTGQPGASKIINPDGTIRPGRLGKFYEFVFIEPSGTSGNPIKVDAKTWGDFKFHYNDLDQKNISPDWKWRKGQLSSGLEIPVFFRINKDEPEYVKDLGLAYLYKLPYSHRVKDLLPKEHTLGFYKPDLAECMFGFTNGENSLKGRVQFCNAWAIETYGEGDRISTVLGSPKASYYPFYIKQQGTDGSVNRDGSGKPFYKTYMDDAILAGWKRYPVRENETKANDLPVGTPTTGIQFTPLNKGAKFIAKINYFNLREVELGALLSALTFHNNATECYHGLGMAKPYGFGRVSLKITNEIRHLEKYLTAFETTVETYLKVGQPDFIWHQSEQVREFIAMTKVQEFLDEPGHIQNQIKQDFNNRMKYMDLPDFAGAKADKEVDGVTETRGFYLEKYTEIAPKNPDITSYSNDKLESEIKPHAIKASEQLKEEKIAFEKLELLKKEDLERKKEAKKEKKRQKEEQDKLNLIKQKEEAEQRHLDELKQIQLAIQAESDRKKQEEQVRIDERNKKLMEEGLEPIIGYIQEFDKAKKRIEQFMDRVGVKKLNDKDTNSLLRKCTEWYNSTPAKQRGKNWDKTQGYDFKKLVSFIGSEQASKWYDEINK